MKAVVWTNYGPPEVLEVREVEKPVPKENEILIKIVATTVTLGDCELRSLGLPVYFSLPLRAYIGFFKPRGTAIPGTELSGVVEAVGKEVTRFNIGDQVFGSAGLGFGASAEYRCLPETGEIALKPTTMSFEEAACVPFGGRDALHFLRKGTITEGDSILILGAGGSIGTFAVQLAKHFGAVVTAVDSPEKLDMLLSIGADKVIDYTKENISNSGQTYDVIFDVVGKGHYSGLLQNVKRNGRLLLANPGFTDMVRGPLRGAAAGKKVIKQAAEGTAEDLLYLKELIEAGKITSVIDRRYPLEQIVEAHRYVETGQKRGNVVINVTASEHG